MVTVSERLRELAKRSKAAIAGGFECQECGLNPTRLEIKALESAAKFMTEKPCTPAQLDAAEAKGREQALREAIATLRKTAEALEFLLGEGEKVQPSGEFPDPNPITRKA